MPDERECAGVPDLMVSVNARIGDMAARQPAGDELWDFFCECGQPGCTGQLRLTLAEYEALKSDGRRLLLPEHSPAGAAGDGKLVRLLEPWAGMPGASEGTLLGRQAGNEQVALVSFWDGGPLRVPLGLIVALAARGE